MKKSKVRFFSSLFNREFSSFKDPSGFIFKKEGKLFRAVNLEYKNHYDLLFSSGLYDALVKDRYLIPHKEIEIDFEDDAIYKVLEPEQLRLISYPYDWSFSMLKDAALLTLKVQELAIKHRMVLKDATAYNIQFIGSQPIFIDTLSFESYVEGQPWQAYGQFCRHFLAPLALMSKVDVSLNKLLISNLDGISLSVTSKLLPLSTKFNFGLYIHLHFHAKSVKRYQNLKIEKSSTQISKKALEHIIKNLSETIFDLKLINSGTEWNGYYIKHVDDIYLKHKKDIVRYYLKHVQPQNVLDLGANDGTFSIIASEYAESVISCDIDPACVEQNYLSLKREKNIHITPLLVDATNPQPAIGWDNNERPRLWDRIKTDTIMALALLHHLCISNNLSFDYIARFLANHCQHLIIEWIPKTDEKVQRLLQNREDVFPDYTEIAFRKSFQSFFFIVIEKKISTNQRLLFLMKTIISKKCD